VQKLRQSDTTVMPMTEKNLWKGGDREERRNSASGKEREMMSVIPGKRKVQDEGPALKGFLHSLKESSFPKCEGQQQKENDSGRRLKERELKKKFNSLKCKRG